MYSQHHNHVPEPHARYSTEATQRLFGPAVGECVLSRKHPWGGRHRPGPFRVPSLWNSAPHTQNTHRRSTVDAGLFYVFFFFSHQEGLVSYRPRLFGCVVPLNERQPPLDPRRFHHVPSVAILPWKTLYQVPSKPTEHLLGSKK